MTKSSMFRLLMTRHAGQPEDWLSYILPLCRVIDVKTYGWLHSLRSYPRREWAGGGHQAHLSSPDRLAPRARIGAVSCGSDPYMLRTLPDQGFDGPCQGAPKPIRQGSRLSWVR